ncbi:MAG: hypothetical protein HKN70_13665 [Gammaproteobacteria bacterium]|nr:hypothetical protein [Gammaproteobacteria bacterium]
MMTILRIIVAVIAGLAVGVLVNMGLIMLGSALIPVPEGVDVTDAESIASSIGLFEPKHFLFPFLAHAVGTLAGATSAWLIGKPQRAPVAYVVGVFFLLGGVVNSFAIPAPVWFTAADLLLAYLPMAWLATMVGQQLAGRSAE